MYTWKLFCFICAASICQVLAAYNESQVLYTWGSSSLDGRLLDNTTGVVLMEPYRPSPVRETLRVVNFTFHAEGPGSVSLQVWRRSSRPMQYFLRGSYKIWATRNGTWTPTKKQLKKLRRLKIRRGDLIGLRFHGTPIIPYNGTECYTERAFHRNFSETRGIVSGYTYKFLPLTRGSLPCRKYAYHLAIGRVLGCPSGWTLLGRNCYFFGSFYHQWSVAKRMCRIKGADLAVPRNEFEHSYLRRKLLLSTRGRMWSRTKDYNLFWIGIFSNLGEWKYASDSLPVTFTKWRVSKPVNYGRYCGTIYESTDESKAGLWKNELCGSYHRYICQKSNQM